jgi:hypothetical protein
LTAIVLLLAAALGSPADDTERAGAIRLAREALGRELGVEPGELAVLDVSPTEWTDSSLGCPEKQMRYLPVLTPGHRVVLEHAGRAHVIHVGAGRAVRCERGTKSFESDKRQVAATVARLLAEARLDLARRLGVPEDEVRPGALRRVTWPDASLGCPQPGELYAQVQTEGFVIELQVAGTRYRYHADREHTVFCPEQRRP